MNDTSSRVKLFLLDESGQWEDKGIGLASITKNTIEVLSEETLESTLNCSIENIQPYRESDTILCWCDHLLKKYALSFQQIESANTFWNSFCQVLGLEKKPSQNNDPVLESPSPQNIPTIFEKIVHEHYLKSLNQNWIHELLDFTWKNKENSEVMKGYFGIFRELINFCKIEVFEAILNDEKFVAVFFVMEFDSEISFRQNFGEYFTEKVRFNNVLMISDWKLLEKIHLAHRVLCLKEALMSKSFKEITIQVLWTYQLSIWNEIIDLFTSLSEIRAQFILKMSENEKSAYLFINEAINFSKFVTNTVKVKFYESLGRDGILKLLQKSWLFQESLEIKRIIIEIFYVISVTLPKIVIESFLAHSEKNYIEIFKDCISMDIDFVHKSTEILKNLIQPSLLSGYKNFYKDIYDEIFGFYADKMKRDPNNKENYECFQEILSIFSHCLNVDTVSIRSFFICHSLIEFFNFLLKSCENPLRISVIKVLKSIISRKDAYLINMLIKSNSFPIVFDLFIENLPRENLFFSSVLSLLIEIKNNNSSEINEYIVKTLDTKNCQVLNSFFDIKTKAENLEIRRPRTMSFDLSSQENFYDFENNYNDFDLIIGKRPNEGFDEPTKKIKKTSDNL